MPTYIYIHTWSHVKVETCLNVTCACCWVSFLKEGRPSWDLLSNPPTQCIRFRPGGVGRRAAERHYRSHISCDGRVLSAWLCWALKSSSPWRAPLRRCLEAWMLNIRSLDSSLRDAMQLCISLQTTPGVMEQKIAAQPHIYLFACLSTYLST